MTPPPPPLGRPRKKDDRLFDPALGDEGLVDTRAQFTQGRWTAARALLAATGEDWDRRGHRVTVLADTPNAAVWAREWLLAEPDSADAVLLLACADVHGALRTRGPRVTPEHAADLCLRAATLLPADPTPWLALLMLSRAHGSSEEFGRHFDQVRVRHPEHHHAHHLMVAHLAERGARTGPDLLHEVYDFAAWAAEEAPADSPLAVLPVIAHAERFRVLGADPDPAGADVTAHWSGRRARHILRGAFDWWLEWERDDHPRNRVDLNFLAHAKLGEGRPAEAAALFHRIGRHATRAPWSYPDRDAHAAFLAAREAALGTV
ncbi:hypothetical protein ACN20G_22170 [Streptomyces sp. BI20]|uniref:hypothetical protein n=1 Tax=Streptomyces sp. BI20 TaxID=3403460 RepID=UPI003C74DC88